MPAGGWWSCEVGGAYEVGVWITIRMDCDVVCNRVASWWGI